MIRTNIKHCTGFLICTLIIFISACNILAGDEYDRLVKKELAKGKKVDSLFLGISFGMTSKTFYAHCWELNKKGVFTDGNNNTMVMYKIDSSMRFPASMNFYPDFDSNKIYRMRVHFQYNAWAPWNKAQFSDSLLPDVLHFYKKWYPGGNDFLKITDKVRGTIYVKVDGNRRITVGKYNDAEVHADYTDLLVEKTIKKIE